MATIAVALHPVTSKRRLALELAARLHRAGHRVVTLGVGDAPTDVSLGIEHAALDLRLPAVAGPRVPWRERRARLAAAESVDYRSLHRTLALLAADLLLADAEDIEVVLAASMPECGTRLVVLDTIFTHWPARGVPPLDSPLLPHATLRSDLAIARAWLHAWVAGAAWGIRRRFVQAEPWRPAVQTALARRLGVRGAVSRWQWLSPFAARSAPTLSLTASELDLPHRTRPHVRAVGPLVALPDHEALRRDDPELAEIVSSAVAEGRRVVVCASGAFVDTPDRDFLALVMAVADRRPELCFVVGGIEPSAALPANVHGRSWIPQRALLAHAHAAIVHSGTGTLHECAASGVPMAVYPFPLNDQIGNASRVVFHGIGVVGERRRVDANRLDADLSLVLDDAAIRGRVAAMAEQLRRYEIDDDAVRAVERLLAHGSLNGP